MNCAFPTHACWGTGCSSFEMSEPASGCSTCSCQAINRAALLDGMTKKRDDIPDATMKRLRALPGAVYAEFKAPKKGRS